MSSMITLRARLVAGCALALVALTGCTHATTQQDPMAGATRLDLSSVLGAVPEQPGPRSGAGTDLPAAGGTDAGLITTPAPGTATAARTTAGHLGTTSTAPTSTPAAAPTPELSLAPLVQEQLPAETTAGDRDPGPVAVPCGGQYAAPNSWCDTPDPAPETVQEQLPGETLGGARCPDPLQVVVAFLADGSAVCGLADDTVTPKG